MEKINYEGGIYEGQLKNGLPHGKGILTYEYGDKYKGQWANGKRNGLGIQEIGNGRGGLISCMKGHFKNDKFIQPDFIDYEDIPDEESEAIDNSINGICDGNDFCLRFNKSTVTKCYYNGQPEKNILSFTYEEGDDYAELSKYDIRKTYNEALVWITFNKVELLKQNGIIDYHRNINPYWHYQSEQNNEFITTQFEAEISLVQISKQHNNIIAFIIINSENESNFYFRLMFSECISQFN